MGSHYHIGGRGFSQGAPGKQQGNVIYFSKAGIYQSIEGFLVVIQKV
jgi:hypothetical protein